MIGDLYEIDKKNLEEHYSRLIRSSHDIKLLQLQFLWKYLNQAPSFLPIIDRIKADYNRFWNMSNSIYHSIHTPMLTEIYQERVYATYYLIDIMLRDNRSQYPMSDIGKKFNKDKNDLDLQSNFDRFNNIFLEQFVNYFLSQTNKNVLILGLLKRYKIRSEWFNDHELLSLIDKQSSVAERVLKRDLYRYLSDQGLELIIEPKSPSGETDLLAIENSGMEKAVIEAKIFDGSSRNATYIIKGFHQLCSYLKDHGESLGYLLIFSKGPTLLSLNLNSGATFPFINLNNRTVFFVVVDIYVHDHPASKRDGRNITEIKASDFQ